MATAALDNIREIGRWQLPAGWEWRRAREFAKIIGGGTPKNAADRANYADDGTPWLTPADLSGYSRSTIARGRRSLSADGLKASSARLLPGGAVLISSRAPVGYCAVAETAVTTNQGFRSLVCDGTADPFFIRYYVLFSRRYLEESASGTTFKELSGTALGELLFPIPPIEVQRRIVASVDELFSELDDGEEGLRRARAGLETYRKSLLKAAVTGELTADWRAANPPKETGADLLQRILAERRARWEADPKNKGKRYKEPAEPEGGLPFEIPTDWACAALGQLGDVVTGGTPPTTRPDFYSGDVPFFTPGDLEGEEVRGTKRTLTEAGRDSVRGVPAKSVLVTCIGATIGKLAIAGTAGATNQQINSVVPAEPALSSWIYAFLSSPFGQHEILDRSSSTTMPILNKGDFSRLPIPLPPLRQIEQSNVALSTRIDERRELLEAVGELSAGPATLRQSIFAAAFRGELVQ